MVSAVSQAVRIKLNDRNLLDRKAGLFNALNKLSIIKILLDGNRSQYLLLWPNMGFEHRKVQIIHYEGISPLLVV